MTCDPQLMNPLVLFVKMAFLNSHWNKSIELNVDVMIAQSVLKIGLNLSYQLLRFQSNKSGRMKMEFVNVFQLKNEMIL